MSANPAARKSTPSSSPPGPEGDRLAEHQPFKPESCCTPLAGRRSPIPRSAIGWRTTAAVAWVVALLLLAGLVGAQPDAGPTMAEAGIPDASSSPPEASVRSLDEARRLVRQAEKVRALLSGQLSIEVDPIDLFDISLQDDREAALEARRLEALLAHVESALDAGVEPDADVDAGVERDAGLRTDGDADAEAGNSTASTGDLPPELWSARLALDRARLAVYRLPREQRLALLTAHARRQKEHATKAASASVTEAERAAQRAAAAQQKALDEARRAKSEAVRLVQEERARLLGIKMQLAETDAELLRGASRLDAQRERALEWRRRVREVVDRHHQGQTPPAPADRLFDELRSVLREQRRQLGAALDDFTAPSAVVKLGVDPLAAIDIEIDLRDVTELRAEVESTARDLAAREREQRWELATLLMQQVESLNADRLTLYEYISADRRRSLTSFDAPGWDQALAEGHQVQLLARYDVHAIGRWIQAVAAGGPARTTAFFLGIDLLQVLALVAFAAWGIRRLGPLLRWWRDGLPVPVISSGSNVTTRLHLWLGVMDRIRLPLGWLLVGWLALWILGEEYRQVLEVRLLWTIIAWNLGAVLVVDLIDALAGRRDSDDEVSPLARLRLSTLRLIGRTVVLIGLTLSLSAQLVGYGTIYAWVLTTCWFLVIPLLLVIVSWWRGTIFERLRLAGSGDAIANWVVVREKRWSRHFAAVVGGTYLLSQNAVRLIKSHLSELVVTRRLLAYLFRRELAKQSLRQAEALRLEPLSEEQLLAFDPEARPPELLPTAADEDVAEVLSAIDAPGGGVFAVIGERGSGKTTLLDRINKERKGAMLVDCPLDGVSGLLTTLGANHDVAGGDQKLATAITSRRGGGAVLVDDAHRLVTPTIGGLDDLDRLLAIARSSSERCTWVLAFDRALWQFVQRSRGARPLFDDIIHLRPWSEEQIAALVQQRSDHADVTPTFEDLLANPSRDDFMRREQLARTAAGFYRLLWDYSSGNPAVALQFWGHSLHQDGERTVHVRLFAAPEMTDLEELPDTTAFVLHAIIQLEPIRVEDLIGLTRIANRDVLDAVRYCLTRGYLERQNGRLRVSWQWYRAVTSLLERRHLQED